VAAEEAPGAAAVPVEPATPVLPAAAEGAVPQRAALEGRAAALPGATPAVLGAANSPGRPCPVRASLVAALAAAPAAVVLAAAPVVAVAALEALAKAGLARSTAVVVGAGALRSSSPLRPPPTPGATRLSLKAKSSSSGEPAPKTSAPSSIALPPTWCVSCSKTVRWSPPLSRSPTT
jgi:hypothetical protein